MGLFSAFKKGMRQAKLDRYFVACEGVRPIKTANVELIEAEPALVIQFDDRVRKEDGIARMRLINSDTGQIAGDRTLSVGESTALFSADNLAAPREYDLLLLDEDMAITAEGTLRIEKE